MRKLKSQPKLIIEMNEPSVTVTCYACPTIFDFDDKDGHHLYFHLRYGCWRLQDETINKVLAHGELSSGDGSCSWEEALEMMEEEGVYFEFE